MCHTHFEHKRIPFLHVPCKQPFVSKRSCHIVQSFEEQILFELTRFFEEVEFAKSMSSAQENEVEV